MTLLVLLKGPGTTEYASSLTGLGVYTTYHVRAYATSADGTGYGAEVDFRTSGFDVTGSAHLQGAFTSTSGDTGSAHLQGAFTSTSGDTGSAHLQGAFTSTSGDTGSAHLQGAFTSTTGDAGSAVLRRAYTGEATGGGAMATSGPYASSLSGLLSGTHYYVRAYATNGETTGYGSVQEFTTEKYYGNATGSATTRLADNYEAIGSAVLRGAASGEAEGSAYAITSGGFTSLIEELVPGTHYYVRAFATNSELTDYGSVVEFDTAAETLGTTTGSAVLRATRTHDASGEAVLRKAGYSSSLTGLVDETHYYVRAWASNSEVVGYGPTLQFDTLPLEATALGSAWLQAATLAPTADGSAVLRSFSLTFHGLMGGLFHTRMAFGFGRSTTGDAVLRAVRTGDADGSATLNPLDMQFGAASGSALLSLPPVVFRGLAGLLFNARKSGHYERVAGGSAVLGLGSVVYAYGSAILLRMRTGDAGGGGELGLDVIRTDTASGSAHLRGPASGNAGGSARLATPLFGEAEGSAETVVLFQGDATGSGKLQPYSDGTIDGSAFLAYGHDKSARGSAMLKSVHKGRVKKAERRQTIQPTVVGRKIARMRRKEAD